MNANRNKCKPFINDSDDPTYENWLVLFACIVNEKISVSNALQIMRLNIKGNTTKEIGVYAL